MSSAHDSSKQATGSGTGSSLARGSACLPCRRRKMRCDGGKPACGQCVTKGRAEDCEYTSDMQGLTKTQMLEENIALLEARIRELENPSEAASSIRLHDPSTLNIPPDMMLAQPMPGVSGPRYHGTESPRSSSSHVQRGSPTVTEPNVQQTHSMINAFNPHASQLGFFLNIPRFLLLAYTSPPASAPPQPSDQLFEPLLTTVCLWGARLSLDPSLSRYESYLLDKSVQQLSFCLFNLGANAGSRGHAILCVIQAEVLLANYFFTLNRFLEGRYHCSAAVSLTVSCRLNTMSTANRTFGRGGLTMDLVRASDLDLPPPGAGNGGISEAMKEGERINAFWTVYILDACWAVALGSPSSMSSSTPAGGAVGVVTTPWPLTMEDYEQGRRVPLSQEDRPITNLLNGAGLDRIGRLSSLALRAKASTLFSHASSLASRYRDDLPMSEMTAFWHDFNNIDSLITQFTNNLPPITPITRTNFDGRDVLVASTLARVAAIQLHVRFARDHTRSRDACLAFARSIVGSVQDVGVNNAGFLDPIMAILLSSVCQVIISEIKAHGPQAFSYGNDYLTRLTLSLDHTLKLMTDFAVTCPLMGAQAAQVQRARRSN